ncbi:MAG: iron ABC transporter permease [Pseudomonadales bacterium]|nr:iron ABC transporter permease [Pseudomonadales bacterium]
MTPTRQTFAMIFLAALVLITMLFSLSLGSTDFRPWQIWQGDLKAQLARDVIMQLRLPRTLAAWAVGGLLGLAGALQQVLLRNPLADPYMLGTSGGASVGALMAILLGAGSLIVTLAAGSGALIMTLLVFILAGHDLATKPLRMLLVGVALASFCGALSSLLLSLAPDGLLRGMVFWLLGDLSGARWEPAMLCLCVCLVVIWPSAKMLNILSLGIMPAHALGIPIQRLQWRLYVVVAVATAFAVTTAGIIGFIGLIVPHALRLVFGTDHRVLLPASALGGGLILLLADIISRVVIAPQQLPVGVVMALAGVPVFLLLLKQRGDHL